jgi:hypothetical protein
MQDIDVGVVFACGARGGEVTCNGSLYDFSTCNDRAVGTRTFAVPQVQEVSVGYQDACARDRSGKVFCWGCNQSNLAGDGKRSGHAAPVVVPL